MAYSVKNFLFRPSDGKTEWHAAERHHPDGIRYKRDRHKAPKAAHFANVLFAMTSVNDRAGAEEQKRFEKSMREQVHDAGCHAAHAQRNHHQTKLRHR